MGKRGPNPKYKRGMLTHCMRTYLTNDQYEDLIKLSNARNETFSETLRECFLTITKKAKEKGLIA